MPNNGRNQKRQQTLYLQQVERSSREPSGGSSATPQVVNDPPGPVRDRQGYDINALFLSQEVGSMRTSRTAFCGENDVTHCIDRRPNL